MGCITSSCPFLCWVLQAQCRQNGPCVSPFLQSEVFGRVLSLSACLGLPMLHSLVLGGRRRLWTKPGQKSEAASVMPSVGNRGRASCAGADGRACLRSGPGKGGGRSPGRGRPVPGQGGGRAAGRRAEPAGARWSRRCRAGDWRLSRVLNAPQPLARRCSIRQWLPSIFKAM